MQKSTSHKLKEQAIYIDGKDRTEEIESHSFEGNKCVVTYKSNGKSYSYHQSKIKIIKSALQTQKAENIFNYFKKIAETIGLKTEEGNNILADSYNRISFIPENSIVSNYLNQKQPEKYVHSSPIEIFPFGFNLSQKDWVNKNLSTY